MFAALLLAAAMGTESPISIASCSMRTSGSYESGVSIGFRNVSREPITKVTFHVHNGKHDIDVNDHGSFAPGTNVRHVLTTPTWELVHGDVASCTVKSVTFASGKVWEAPPHP